MPTLLTHPAVPLALGVALGQRIVPRRLLLAGVVCACLPDADVLAFELGIPYGHPFGHRGFSHSLSFAVLLAAAGALAARRMAAQPWPAFAFLFLATASHGLLDGITNGGRGIGFLIPFDGGRYFLPWQVVEVSPIGIGGFLSERGMRVLGSELLWIWAPLLLMTAVIWLIRRTGSSCPSDVKTRK